MIMDTTMPISRRQLLERTCLGFGNLVLADLARATTYNDLKPRPTHFPAKAKAVIQLVQNGGPSQMDLFDPKPELAKRAGEPLPGGVEIHQPNNVNTLLPSPFEFRKHGQCGMDISEMLPHIAGIADEACFIRSMHTEHNNHLEGLNMLLTELRSTFSQGLANNISPINPVCRNSTPASASATSNSRTRMQFTAGAICSISSINYSANLFSLNPQRWHL